MASDTGSTTTDRISNLRGARYAGIYDIPDAALYLRATTPPPDVPLRMWERHRRVKFILPNSKHLYAWIRRETEDYSRREAFLTFEQLIRLRMIVILRSRGLTLENILGSEVYLRQLMQKPQPYVTENIWNNTSDIFAEFGMLISATKRGQIAWDFLKDFLTPVHHGIEFDEAGISAIWKPAPGILIDPEIQFGAPCIEGTRIQTEAVWSFRQAGETIPRLAEWYAIEPKRIENAIEWEETLARAA